MIDFIATFAGAVVALLFWELIKVTGLTLLKSEAPKAVVQGLQLLDQFLPKMIYEGMTGEQMEAEIRRRLGALTGQEWADIRRRFDPVIFIDNLKP